MGSKRLFARTLASLITSIALVGGVGVVEVAQADTMTAAQHCAKERKDVRVAKKKLKKAKKIKNKAKRTKAVKKAKKNLKRQKAQKARWCARANATTKAQETRTDYQAISSNPQKQSLPPSLQSAIDQAVSTALATLSQLDVLIPTASQSQVAQILTKLNAMDPTTLEFAIEDLADQLASMGGDPAAVSALVDGLLAQATAGVQAPGDLGTLQETLQTFVATLQGFNPSAGQGDLSQLENSVDTLIDQLESAAAPLTTLFDQLGTLNGGTLPTDPTDLLGLLDDALSGVVGDATTSAAVGALVGGLLGGLGLGLCGSTTHAPAEGRGRPGRPRPSSSPGIPRVRGGRARAPRAPGASAAPPGRSRAPRRSRPPRRRTARPGADRGRGRRGRRPRPRRARTATAARW
jgi:Skp family chaperone for outer membrane proteins